MTCLAKRAEERPADAGALLAQLDQGWTGAAWTLSIREGPRTTLRVPEGPERKA